MVVKRVLVLLISVISLMGSWGIRPAHGGVYFSEEFDTLDPSRWTVYENGYPDPAVYTDAGFLYLGQPGVSSLDFPVVYSGGNPFPAGGDFTLEIGFQYTSQAFKGDGLVVLDGANTSVGLGFWSASTHGLIISNGTSSYTLSPDTAYHTLRYEISGTNVTAYLDGTLLGISTLAGGSPESLYIGHPTVGQVFGTGCGNCDADGNIVSRWWSTGVWTTLGVDYIRVTTTVPEPSTLILLGSGLLGFVVLRRRLGV